MKLCDKAAQNHSAFIIVEEMGHHRINIMAAVVIAKYHPHDHSSPLIMTANRQSAIGNWRFWPSSSFLDLSAVYYLN